MQPTFKRQIPVLPIVLCGLFGGIGLVKLFLENDLWTAFGFICASGMAMLAHTYAMFASKLLLANHTTCQSFTNLIADLEEAGFHVNRVHSTGDVDTYSAKLEKRDLN